MKLGIKDYSPAIARVCVVRNKMNYKNTLRQIQGLAV